MVLLGAFTAIVSGVAVFFISKKVSNANFDIYVEQAKAKAKAIESEAELLLHKANLKSQEIELEARKEYESVKDRVKRDMQERTDELQRKDSEFIRYKESETHKLKNENLALSSERLKLKRNEKALQLLKNDYESRIDDVIRVLEGAAGMTREEAKKMMLQKVIYLHF